MDLYEFVESTRSNPKFGDIDATYVLHLKGSSRLKNVQEQLSTHPLTSKTFIMENPGYKKVNKPLPRQNSEADVAYSHYIACKHALENNFNRVLVLEDDFIIEKELLDQNVTNDVQDYLDKDGIDHYFLGCTPFIAVPSSLDLKHWRVLYGGCAHAVIHTLSGLKKLVEAYETKAEEIYGIDLYLFGNHKCYMHYQPLITQTFPETENKKTAWGSGDFAKDITSSIIEWLNLDKETQPGYGYIYTFSKCSVIIVIALTILLIFIVRWIYNKFTANAENLH